MIARPNREEAIRALCKELLEPRPYWEVEPEELSEVAERMIDAYEALDPEWPDR